MTSPRSRQPLSRGTRDRDDEGGGPRWGGRDRHIYVASCGIGRATQVCTKVAAPGALTPFDAVQARDGLTRLHAARSGKYGHLLDDVNVGGPVPYDPRCSGTRLAYVLCPGSPISTAAGDDVASRVAIGFFRLVMLWGLVPGGHGARCGELDRGAILVGDHGAITILAPPRALDPRSRARRVLARVHCTQGDRAAVRSIGDEEHAETEALLLHDLCASLWTGAALPCAADVHRMVRAAGARGRDADDELRQSVDAVASLMLLLDSLRVPALTIGAAMKNLRPWDTERPYTALQTDQGRPTKGDRA